MSDFKKILVPIAFSRHSQDIIAFASTFATPLEANLVIVNVINKRDLDAIGRITSYGYEVDEEHYLSTIQEERAKQLDDMMKNVPFPGENISFNFRVGDPTDELMRVVVEEDIDLVVMGMKSKTELEYVFAGSVAERFFRRCPVTVIFYRDADSSDKLRQRLIKHKR